MTDKLILKISERLNETCGIFSELVDKIEMDDENYFSLARRCAELEVRCEKMEVEMRELEYDKKYFEKELKRKISF